MKGGAGGGGRRNFHDPLLLHRVSECVADASSRKRPLDPDDLADGLRRTHREYQRKQRGPFLRGVAQAIQIVLERAAEAESRGEQQPQHVRDGAEEGEDRSEGEGGEGGDNYEDAQEQQGEPPREEPGQDREGGGQEQGLEDEGLEGSSRYTGSASMASAQGTLMGSTRSGDRRGRNSSVDARLDGEGAVHGARSSAVSGPVKKPVAGVVVPTSSTPQNEEQQREGDAQVGPKAAGAPGAPPAHPSANAGPSKNKRQATGAPTPTPSDPQSKRRRQAVPKPSAGAGALPGSSLPGSSSFRSVPRRVPLSSLGGIEGVLAAVRELILQPLAHPELYAWLGVQPPRGVLLHGPPGCGKTMLAHAIAHEAQVPFFKISAPEIVSGMSGESEAKIRDLFREAEAAAPSVVFIDEIDAITPKRETAQREMERRIVAQLLTCIDDLGHTAEDEEGGKQGDRRVLEEEGGGIEGPMQGGAAAAYRHVVVLGATNRPDALDPALRRAGRFDREIAVGIPDEAARARILEVLSRGLRLQGGFDFRGIARRTAGFVGADLAAVAKEAAALAVKRILAGAPGCTPDPAPTAATAPGCTTAPGEGVPVGPLGVPGCSAPGPGGVGAQQQGEGEGEGEGGLRRGRGAWSVGELAALSIRMEDFAAAVGLVQPSAKREGFSTIPGVTWADVGALGAVREELRLSISRPIRFPEEFQALGLTRATGVLLYGPPGCGKTLVAQAIANDAGANFISIKGPELLNKFVGESERAVRQLFARARSSSPCILFFDEMDAMAPRRGSDSNGAAERVVNQLLTEMDGLEGRGSVFLVAATNRPDMLDPALLRPGRLDRLLYVPLPDAPGRASILATLLRKVPSVSAEVNARALAADPRCARFSGADLAALVREACVAALRERLGGAPGGDGTTPGEGAPAGDRLGGTPAGDGTNPGEGAPAVVSAISGEGTPAGDGEPLAGCTPGGDAAMVEDQAAGEGIAGRGGVGSKSGPEGSGGEGTGPVISVQQRHFEAALQRIRPSVSPQDLEHYERVKDAIHGARGHVGTM